jgi:hypothetical protein
MERPVCKNGAVSWQGKRRKACGWLLTLALVTLLPFTSLPCIDVNRFIAHRAYEDFSVCGQGKDIQAAFAFVLDPVDDPEETPTPTSALDPVNNPK